MARISDSEFQQQVHQATTLGAFNLADANVDDEELGALLQKLSVEPDNDEERASKFLLYEKYAETLGDTRKAALDLWQEARIEFPDAARATIEQAITQIDRHDAMGLHFQDNMRRWFVYDMARQAHRNSGHLEALLEEIKRKLRLLIGEEGEDMECPICLGELGEGISGDGGADEGKVTTLACCHKMCAECWTNWDRVNHGRAFCPLCRQGDFTRTVDMGVPQHQGGAAAGASAFNFGGAAPAAPGATPAFNFGGAFGFGNGPAPAPANPFGAPAVPTGGSFSFGNSAPAFGAAPSPFGAAPPAFGAPVPAFAFGAAPSPFGAPVSAAGPTVTFNFGPAPAAANPFGAPAAPVFGHSPA
jgi:hypothetical protein